MEHKNSLIEPENYFKGYAESAEKLKNQPEILELDKLCYEVFEHYEPGKKLMEVLVNRFLLAPSSTPGSTTFDNEVKFGEGLRYAFLLLRNCVKSHKQRIMAQEGK